MIKLQNLLVIVLFLAVPAIAKDKPISCVRWIEVPIDNKQIVRQEPNESSCGYASILNSLRFGGPANQRVSQSLSGQTDAKRVQYLIDIYGAKPSKTYKSGQRQRTNGVSCDDLCDTYNDVRQAHNLSPLFGSYLDRRTDETPQQLLARVHKLLAYSLKQGEPPIISLWSEAANWHPNINVLLWDILTGKNPMKDACLWTNLGAHFVTVVGVPEAVNTDGSFSVDYIDSNWNKEQLLLYRDVRDFGAQKGAGKKSEWLKGHPFLTASGGSLYLKTQHQPWSTRTEIFLNYAIYKK